MTKKLFAVVLLSLTLAACEPASTDNNSNANNAKPNTAASTPAPVAPSPEPSAAVKPQVKAGDKVKVTLNGAATDATVVRVDEKSGKVTLKLQGQKEEKTVAIADVVKE
jgi:sRNA-binding protein